MDGLPTHDGACICYKLPGSFGSGELKTDYSQVKLQQTTQTTKSECIILNGWFFCCWIECDLNRDGLVSPVTIQLRLQTHSFKQQLQNFNLIHTQSNTKLQTSITDTCSPIINYTISITDTLSPTTNHTISITVTRSPVQQQTIEFRLKTHSLQHQAKPLWYRLSPTTNFTISITDTLRLTTYYTISITDTLSPTTYYIILITHYLSPTLSQSNKKLTISILTQSYNKLHDFDYGHNPVDNKPHNFDYLHALSNYKLHSSNTDTFRQEEALTPFSMRLTLVLESIMQPYNDNIWHWFSLSFTNPPPFSVYYWKAQNREILSSRDVPEWDQWSQRANKYTQQLNEVLADFDTVSSHAAVL